MTNAQTQSAQAAYAAQTASRELHRKYIVGDANQEVLTFALDTVPVLPVSLDVRLHLTNEKNPEIDYRVLNYLTQEMRYNADAKLFVPPDFVNSSKKDSLFSAASNPDADATAAGKETPSEKAPFFSYHFLAGREQGANPFLIFRDELTKMAAQGYRVETAGFGIRANDKVCEAEFDYSHPRKEISLWMCTEISESNKKDLLNWMKEVERKKKTTLEKRVLLV